MTDPPDRQRVWPLFVLAAALVAFGFWYLFAFPVTNPAEPTSLPSPFLEQAPMPSASEPVEGSVDLFYAPESHDFVLDLRQVRRADDAQISSRIALSVVDTAEPTDDDETMAWGRRYPDATVQVADEAIIGRSISAEIERLLANSAHRVVTDRSGETKSYDLISSESAQLRQTLVLVRDALAILRPRFPREPVRMGEEWSWTVPIRARPRDEEDASTVDGKIDLRGRVVGREARGIVIEVDLTSTSEGTIVSDGETRSFETSGEGQADVVWSADSGQIVESVATQTETTTLEGRVVETKHSLRLLAE